jgi:hypothetical protein
MTELSVAFSPLSLKLRRALLAIHPRPSGQGILAKESNGPRLHGGYPIGFVPAASRQVSQLIKSLFNLKHHLIWTDGNNPGMGIVSESGKA